MSKVDILRNVEYLVSSKKAFTMVAISYLSANIEEAIKYDEFFHIDFENHAKKIIDRAGISPSRKEEIRQMFINYVPKPPEEDPEIKKLQLHKESNDKDQQPKTPNPPKKPVVVQPKPVPTTPKEKPVPIVEPKKEDTKPQAKNDTLSEKVIEKAGTKNNNGSKNKQNKKPPQNN